MSTKINLLKRFIKELIKQELDEASTTGAIDGGEGPPKTPYAFSGGRKKDKEKEDKIAKAGGYMKVKESVNEEKYVVYVDKDGKGMRGRKIVKSGLSQMGAKRLYNKLVKTDDYQEVGYDDHKSWNQNNIEKLNEEKVKKLSVYMPKKTTKELPQIKKFVQRFVPNAKFDMKGNVLHIDGGGKSMKRLSQLIYNEFYVDKVMWNESVNEGKYHDYRNDESLTPRQKIGESMRQVRNSLSELNKLIDMNIKLKNELNVDSGSYWKNTHKALHKISERLVKLANKVGQLQ